MPVQVVITVRRLVSFEPHGQESSLVSVASSAKWEEGVPPRIVKKMT